MAKGLPHYDRFPAFLIGRLARDLSMRGRGLGRHLLADALSRIVSMEAAGRFVVVDPVDERAAAFYARYGFTQPGTDAARLLLPMSTIRKGESA